MELYKPAERLVTPLKVPMDRLLCGPGPSNCHPRVLKASSLPLLGHLHPEFLSVMADITAGLQYVFQTSNPLTIAVSGTGHAGMEAAMVNIVEPGDSVLVLQNGIWGDRAREVASRCGGEVYISSNPPDEVFTLQQICEELERYHPAILFVCQGESSVGLYQPLAGIGRLCHKHDCLLLVDTVASLGGAPFLMDQWEVDVVYSGSQKVLGAPPGSAPISFSQRAKDKMSARKSKVQSFYFDMEWLSRYWGVEGRPRVYHHTAPVSNFYALREGLAMVAEEGLESAWKRHRSNAEMLWAGLEKLGLEMYIGDKSVRLPTVTAIRIPEGVKWKELVSYIMQKYSIEVSGGLGPTVGKVWRIGLMGDNSRPEVVERVLAAVQDGLKHCSRPRARL